MHNISKFILTFFIAIPLVFAFGSQTVKQIDEIKNNTGTDIVLNPTDKVKINYFAGEKALQSTVDGELEESAVTNTELGFVSGVTSSIQTQIDSKTPLTRLINTTAPLQGGGDLTTDRTLSILQSGAAQDGYLSSTDWNTFNNKQNAITGTDGDLYYWNSGLSNLAIGTTNQILQVSALGFPEWADLPPSVSVTTKGDIQTYSTAPDRLPVGTDNQILSANSATSTGLEWIDPPNTSPTTTQGDIIIRGATEDERLPIGTVDQILVSNGTTLAYQDLPVSLPDQTGHSGEYLRSNGTDADWQNVNDSVNDVKDNLLECASFEDCTFEGVITTSGTSDSAINARSSEVSAYNDSKLNLSATAASTLDYTFTETANFDGKQMVAYCEIKTANTGVTFSVGADGVEAGSLDVSSDNSWKYYKIPFVGGATTQYFKVDHANAGEIPNIDIDNCFIGKSAIVQQFEYTENIGFRAGDTSGLPVLNGSAIIFGTEYFDNGGDNYNPTTGVYTVPVSGVYHVNARVRIVGSAAYLIAINVNGSQVSRSYESNTTTSTLDIQEKLELNAGDTVTITNATGATITLNGSVRYNFFSVQLMSKSQSTVVTQDTELTAKTANEINIYSSSSSIFSTDYGSTSDYTVSSPATGRILLDYSSLNLTQPPVVQASIRHQGGVSADATVNFSSSPSTTSVEIYTIASGSAYNPTVINWSIKKQGTDVNKSQTIVGKFENINSSDLCEVKASGNGTDNINSTSEDIPWINIEKDNCNIWTNAGNTGNNTPDSITPKRSAWYTIKFTVDYDSALNASVYLYKNGVQAEYIEANYNAGLSSIHSGGGLFYLEKDQVYSIRMNNIVNLDNSALTHYFHAIEHATTESIIKNLSDQAVKCQTKVLSADVPSTGASQTIADWNFSNLTVGKKYRIFGKAQFFSTIGQAITIDSFYNHNSTNIQRFLMQEGYDAGATMTYNLPIHDFTALSTSIDYNISFTTNMTLKSGSTGSYLRLCELPSTYVSTQEF